MEDQASQPSHSKPRTLSPAKPTMIATKTIPGVPGAAKMMPRYSPNVWMKIRAVCRSADGISNSWQVSVFDLIHSDANFCLESLPVSCQPVLGNGTFEQCYDTAMEEERAD